MGLSNLFNKNKKIKTTKEAYGENVLGRLLLISGEQYKKICEDLEKKVDFGEYLEYVQYLLYLSQKILEEKYSSSDAKIIALHAINGAVKYMDYVPEEKKSEMKNLLQEQYLELIRDVKCNIRDEKDMHRLVTSYMNGCEMETCFLTHQALFAAFCGFIKFHINDILNPKIELM